MRQRPKSRDEEDQEKRNTRRARVGVDAGQVWLVVLVGRRNKIPGRGRRRRAGEVCALGFFFVLCRTGNPPLIRPSRGVRVGKLMASLRFDVT